MFVYLCYSYDLNVVNQAFGKVSYNLQVLRVYHGKCVTVKCLIDLAVDDSENVTDNVEWSMCTQST